jgi:hypothetical protein
LTQGREALRGKSTSKVHSQNKEPARLKICRFPHNKNPAQYADRRGTRKTKQAENLRVVGDRSEDTGVETET